MRSCVTFAYLRVCVVHKSVMNEDGEKKILFYLKESGGKIEGRKETFFSSVIKGKSWVNTPSLDCKNFHSRWFQRFCTIFIKNSSSSRPRRMPNCVNMLHAVIIKHIISGICFCSSLVNALHVCANFCYSSLTLVM